MGQIKLTVGLMMIVLFSAALMGFAITFAEDNNAAISITDDDEMGDLRSQLVSGADTFKGDSEDQYQSMLETTTTAGGTSRTTGSFSVTPSNVIGASTNVLQVGYKKIFGTGSGFGMFLTSLLAIILFMIGLFIYKTLRGNPD